MLAVEILAQLYRLAGFIDEGCIKRELLIQVLLDVDAVQDGGQLVVCRLTHLLLTDRRNLGPCTGKA